MATMTAEQQADINSVVIQGRYDGLVAQGFTEGTAQGFSEVQLDEMMSEEFGPDWAEYIQE